MIERIECLTGYNITTGKTTNMIKVKVNSPSLSGNSKLLIEKEKEIKESFIKDIAK